MKSIFKRYQITKTLAISGVIMLCTLSCTSDNTPLPDQNKTNTTEESYKINPDIAIKPQRIVIEMREGHSHLGKDENPKPGVGDIFFGPTGSVNVQSGLIKSGGFHANPFDPENNYPMKREQSMTFELQPDQTYKQTAGVDAFRLMTSPIYNGLWKALVIKMYDKENNRIDLQYRTPEMSKRTQIFFLIKNIAEIPQTPVKGVTVADTTYLFKNETDYREDFQEVFDKYNFDTATPIPLIYHTNKPYTANTAPEQIFSYYYCDRATDNTLESPTLDTPVGFRGVFENRTCYVSYTIDILLTVLPEGQTKEKPFATAESPTSKQLKNIAFAIKIPFRNITEQLDTKNASVSEPIKGWFDEAWGEDSFINDSGITTNVILNKILHLPVKREYPDYSMQELIKDYKGVQEANPETSPFWL